MQTKESDISCRLTRMNCVPDNVRAQQGRRKEAGGGGGSVGKAHHKSSMTQFFNWTRLMMHAKYDEPSSIPYNNKRHHIYIFQSDFIAFTWMLMASSVYVCVCVCHRTGQVQCKSIFVTEYAKMENVRLLRDDALHQIQFRLANMFGWGSSIRCGLIDM